MKTISEIKQLFENKSYAVRSDFIDEYDFKDSYHDYYKKYIIENVSVIKNHLYQSDLIDLAGWLDIYDPVLRTEFLSFLFTDKHYLVKLAVLDYFKFCQKEMLDEDYEIQLHRMLEKRNVSILRNQVLINLIVFNSDRAIKYVDNLLQSLNNTNDWRSIYRTLKNIKELKIKKTFSDKIFKHIVFLSGKRDFGEGVNELLSKG